MPGSVVRSVPRISGEAKALTLPVLLWRGPHQSTERASKPCWRRTGLEVTSIDPLVDHRRQRLDILAVRAEETM